MHSHFVDFIAEGILETHQGDEKRMVSMGRMNMLLGNNIADHYWRVLDGVVSH